MARKYDIILKATIEIGGVFEADDAQQALAAAQSELRSQGQIGDIVAERCIYLDEPDPDDLPAEAYDPTPGF